MGRKRACRADYGANPNQDLRADAATGRGRRVRAQRGRGRLRVLRTQPAVRSGRAPGGTGERAPFVTPVLLFVNATSAQVERALQSVPQALLQFHGNESDRDCVAFGRAYVRAVAMVEGVDLLDWEQRYPTASALLADAPSAA